MESVTRRTVWLSSLGRLGVVELFYERVEPDEFDERVAVSLSVQSVVETGT